MSDFLHLTRPSAPGELSSFVPGPITANVEAQALFAILEHSLRASKNQKRVIGTLLGSRSEDGSEIEIRNSYAVSHEESDNEVIIDEDRHRSLYLLHRKANPKDVIVGWYSTSPKLDSFSGLIHGFYCSQVEGVYSYPPIHLTIQTEDNKESAIIPKIKTFISSPIGINSERTGSYFFNPIPNKISYNDLEKLSLDYISQAQQDLTTHKSKIINNDLSNLTESFEKIESYIDTIQEYVEKVISGEIKGDDKLGRFLLSNLYLTPSVSKENLETVFNSHTQDLLMVEYLAATIKTQLQLSSKLTTLI